MSLFPLVRKNIKARALVYVGFHGGSCPCLWLVDGMPRAPIFTVPHEHIWLPDRLLCKAAKESLKGMCSASVAIDYNPCRCSARCVFLFCAACRSKTQLETRACCITLSSDWHDFNSFLSSWGRWTEHKTPLCPHIRIMFSLKEVFT